MDPLSITVAIPTLATTVLKVSVQLRDIKQAPLKIAKLRRDIQQFRHEVDILARQCRHPRIARHLPVEEVVQILSEAQRDLNAVSSTLQSVTGRGEQLNRLTLYRCERRCRQHRTQLGDSLERLRRLNALMTVDLICQASASTSSINSNLWLAQLEQRQQAFSRSEGVVTSQNASAQINDADHSNVQTTGQEAAPVVPGPKPLISSKSCSCQCHDRSTKTHHSSELGALLPFIFSSPLNRCTNFRCCARRRKSEPKIVVLPDWLKTAAIATLLARKPSLRNSIPVRPVIPEGSDASRYAKTGNALGLRRLLARGLVVPSATTPDGWTLLHSAVYNSQSDTVKLLLNEHADSNATEDGQRTPADLARVRALMVGATEEQIRIANLFPDAEDFKDDYHLTAVHIAALDLYDHEDHARPSLLEVLNFIDDADNAPSNTDWKKFRTAEKKSSTLYASIIATYADRAHAKPPIEAQTPIIDQPDSKHGWTPFFWAAYTGRRAVLETLIKSGADPFTLSEKKRNALHLAAESKDPSIMSYTLDRPPYRGQWFDIDHPDYWGETPLHVAAYGSAACVKLLLDHGANRSALQKTKQVPLHYASLVDSKTEKFEIVKALSSDLGPHINHQDEEGRSPILDLLDSPESVQLLLERGADVSLLDKVGRSVFHHAAIEDAAESLKILLDHDKTSLRISRDNEGHTPLDLAFQHESCAAIFQFVTNDAIGDLHHEDRWSLVHRASFLGDAGVLECIVKHHSFVRGELTSKGETAADIAKAAGHWKGRVKDLLKAYDSKGQIAEPSSEERAISSMSRAEYMLAR